MFWLSRARVKETIRTLQRYKNADKEMRCSMSDVRMQSSARLQGQAKYTFSSDNWKWKASLFFLNIRLAFYEML